jgi:hypothetical protein
MKLPENMEEALSRAGLGRRAPLLLKQKHGAVIHCASKELLGKTPLPVGDGWVSDLPGEPVAVYAADCLPVFLWDKDLRAVGAFHAGWRGLAADMMGAAVSVFQGLGLAPGSLRAAVGPHAGPCCYQVGEELRRHFAPESLLERSNGLFLDLGAEARVRLVEAGLDPGEVSVSSDCTICSPEGFFSWRREGKDRRILAFIALPSERNSPSGRSADETRKSARP